MRNFSEDCTALTVHPHYAGVGRVSTAVILIWLLALAWKAMEEYQRSRRWPPPV